MLKAQSELIIVDIESSGCDEVPMGVEIPKEDMTVFETWIHLKKNEIIIQGDGPYLKGDNIKVKELKEKFIGKKISLEIECIPTGKIELIKEKRNIISQYPSKVYIEGRIIKTADRIGHFPNGIEKPVREYIIDCGIPIYFGRAESTYEIDDWIHVDGWLLFSNISIKE